MDMDNFRNRTLEGEWWDASAPANRYAGKLVLDDNFNGTLDFTVPSSSPLHTEIDHVFDLQGEAIHGYTYAFSLPSSIRTRVSTGAGSNKTKLTFSSNTILVGVKAKSEDHAIFHAVRVSLTGLTDVFGPTGFRGGFRNPGVEFGHEKVALKFEGARKAYRLSPEVSLNLVTRYRGPWVFENQKRLTLSEEGLIELEFAKPSSLKAIFREILVWQAFVTLATGQASYIKGMALSGSDMKYGGGALFPGLRKSDEPENLPRDMLFSFPRLGRKLLTVLSSWRAHFDNLEMPVLLFAGTFFQTDAYLHTKLLAYLQALEVLHREQFPGNKFPNPEIRRETISALRGAIPEHLSADLKTSVENFVGNLGEYSLFERLIALLAKYPKSLGSVFPNGKDDLKVFRDARNYLTHYGDNQKFGRSFISSKRLVEITRRAKLFLEVCLLGLMGLKDLEILKILETYEPFHDAQP